MRTYRLPALDEERVCEIETPDGWYANWDKLRFTGHQDYFALELAPKQPPTRGGDRMPHRLRIYDGRTGKLFHELEGITVGHHDFSSDGKLALWKALSIAGARCGCGW